jgi:hypothetical protein
MQAAAVKLAASDLDSEKIVASSVPKNVLQDHEGRISEKFLPPGTIRSVAATVWMVAC